MRAPSIREIESKQGLYEYLSSLQRYIAELEKRLNQPLPAPPQRSNSPSPAPQGEVLDLPTIRAALEADGKYPLDLTGLTGETITPQIVKAAVFTTLPPAINYPLGTLAILDGVTDKMYYIGEGLPKTWTEVVLGSGPVESASVQLSANQSIASGVNTAISFGTVLHNIGGVYSGANPTRLTAPSNGIYHIGGQIVWDSDPNGYRRIYLMQGGATNVGKSAMMPVTAGGIETAHTVSRIIALSAGNYIELYGLQTSGVALNAKTGVDTHFYMHKLANN